MRTDAVAIKSALRDRAPEFARWLFPAGKQNGHEWLVGSLNGEPGRSLSICIKGNKAGVFADFAGDEKGDNFVELFRRAKQVSFKEALAGCAEWLGESAFLRNATRVSGSPDTQTRSAPASEKYCLSDEECQRALKMAEALSSDRLLCERIARARGWKPDTIRQLAMEAHLGWNDGRLCFIYDTGLKQRWRENGERIIRWAFGKPWIWRGAWIPMSETVYLCEGETDAITLIDGGIEDEPQTVAVAMPSASTFDASWADMFTAKSVVLAFDNDAAGNAATARVSKLLQGRVKSLGKLNWEGLQYATNRG